VIVVRIAATVDAGPRRAQSLQALLDVVHTLNCQWLRAHPHAPNLYASGTVYRREPVELREDFATLPVVLARGWGDCDDLAPALSAELVVRRGIAARPVVLSIRPGLWHCVVRLPSGRLLDPSRALGMDGDA
jgi:hypothetical protein